MKKLLFFTVALGFAVGLHAQQTQVRESVPASVQKPFEKSIAVQQPAKSATILNADMQKITQKSHKADVNYTPIGIIANGEFTTNQVGVPPSVSRDGSSQNFTLFPDSLALDISYFINLDSTMKSTTFRGTGFVFDPYSRSFDPNALGQRDLFEAEDKCYGWKVDTILSINEYSIANYNVNSPDTLRCYAYAFNYYGAKTDSFYYYETYFVDGNRVPFNPRRQAILPYVKYITPIPEKGVAVTPLKPDYLTWDYILTDEDSILVEPGYIGRKGLSLVIPNGGMEIEPGSVFVFFMHFIPGYDYDLNDTISTITWNTSLEAGSQFISSNLKMNRFSAYIWNFPNGDVMHFFDSEGYNTFLMENNDTRYNLGNSTINYYSGGYHAKTAFYLNVYQGDNHIYREPKVTPAIAEIGDIVSNIYPNPATTQLSIDLKEQGNADLTIYNILGQTVRQEPLSDMQNTINIAELPAGVYMVKVTQNKKSHTIKLIKE